MPHPLVCNLVGAVTPTVARMVNGTLSDTEDLGSLSGASADHTSVATNQGHYLPCNRVFEQGERIFVSAQDDVWQKDGDAGSFTAQSLSLDITTNGAVRIRRSPMIPTLRAAGPGWTTFYQSGTGSLMRLDYDYLTDAYSETDMGSLGTWETAVADWFVLNGVYWGSTLGKLVKYDFATDTQDVQSTPVSTIQTYSICNVGESIFLLGVDDTAANSEVKVKLLVGSVWANVATLSDTAVFVTGVSSAFASGMTVLLYEKDGTLYALAPNRNSGDSYTPNGYRMFSINPSTYAVTEITNTTLAALLRPDGGLSTGDTGQGGEFSWRPRIWKVIEDDFGTERVYIQFFFGTQDQSSAIFEHTASGLSFVGTSAWTGYQGQVQNRHGHSNYYWASGNLKSMPAAPPNPVTGGVEVSFRAFGDAGNSNKVCKLWYSETLNGPKTQATIVAPSGGTGGATSIVANALVNVDANGEDGSPTTYTVEHDFDEDDIAGSTPLHYFVSVDPAS